MNIDSIEEVSSELGDILNTVKLGTNFQNELNAKVTNAHEACCQKLLSHESRKKSLLHKFQLLQSEAPDILQVELVLNQIDSNRAKIAALQEDLDPVRDQIIEMEELIEGMLRDYLR
ncbi:hypothetical protein Ciccas_004053 [Cichlidogyrus casuarinus]|uniref:Uncharacterized protein n=1 Tax=Cichlidogyrus casuarinus TaxID=1844966 RepID=A0ABD2QCS5_9PLAT